MNYKGAISIAAMIAIKKKSTDSLKLVDFHAFKSQINQH